MPESNDETKVAQPWESLGYDSFDEYVAAKDKEKTDAVEEVTSDWTGRLSTAQTQIDADQSMIQRQGNELGVLRKLKSGEQEEVVADKDDTADADAREARFKEQNSKRETALTDEQFNVLEESFNGLDENQRALVQTEEGRSEFMTLVLGENSTVTTNTFKRPVPEKKITIAEQLRIALGQAEAGSRPAASRSSSGVQLTETAETKKKTARPMASKRTGDIRSMLNDINEKD